ncbi:MAG TPA: hypothetical protein VE309_02775 [Caulobacteraceae bacterium]|nr:hypothetical protein [Caulobacteraceae bacterium]
MYRRVGLICFLLLLAAAPASADILPTLDRGPPSGGAGGLGFSIRSVIVEGGPQSGPHYSKTEQVVVLDDCTDGRPNCTLAKSRNLIGAQVETVDGQGLRPQDGMVRQILDAFANKAAGATITFELYSRASGGRTIKVSFARD